MNATLHPMASAQYYVMSQLSMHQLNTGNQHRTAINETKTAKISEGPAKAAVAHDYHAAGVEPDSVSWRPPSGLLNLTDSATVIADDSPHLYYGLSPDPGAKLTQTTASTEAAQIGETPGTAAVADEYYSAGVEPDGVWWNPSGLLGLTDSGKVNARDFHRLYHGFSPETGEKLTRTAGSKNRSPGLDITLNADKSVSALWALASPEKRAEIERAQHDAAREALELTIARYCANTRHGVNGCEIVTADILGALWQHGESRAGDPHLHTHCTILNLARSHKDGEFKTLYQRPIFQWVKAIGAVYSNRLAWMLQQRLGIRMERYGDTGMRVAGIPKDLEEMWSKRHNEMKIAADNLGFSLGTNTARTHAVQRLTRAPKSTDASQVREGRWNDEAIYIGHDTFVAALFNEIEPQTELTPEQLRELTAALDELPAKLTHMEAVFHFTHIIAAVSHATGAQLDKHALDTAISRLLHHPDLIELPAKRARDAVAGLAHTRVYSTHDTVQMETALTNSARRMAGRTTHAIPSQAFNTKISALLRHGYNLSDEQISAIHHATASGASLSIIEGAAGAGKTTTLRPIVDLYREHGYTVIGAANAWITANTLGSDCNIKPFAIAKLLSSLAKGHLTLDERTLLVIDEAGMLSSRALHNLLRITEQCGAKVILAGDTKQQQPIEAGPGLRLARDGAHSIRVDTIRRQLPDLEDVLVHAHGETPETARLRASMTPPDERARVLADYEASPAKPVFTPWQVAASEAFRDGKAAEGITAYHTRGHVHLCRSTEATLNQLADDWARYRLENPTKTTIALARTNLERQALSERMRQHHLSDTALDQTVTVRVSEGQNGKRTTPLDIAPGEHLRIGATQWEKQLYNGDIVVVQSLETHQHPDTQEDRLLIKGQTLRDGRNVTFYHDDIHDWHGNVRLSHGYALTFASAQGTTVDHAFVLTDDMPARQTLYPATTRHREGMDLYINRRPIAFSIEDRRPEDEQTEAVTDLDVLDYLARSWSRTQPKEAARDYLTRPSEQKAKLAVGALSPSLLPAIAHDNPLAHPDEQTPQITAASPAPSPSPLPAIAIDNTLSRIGRKLRERALAYHHGPRITQLAAERADVLQRVETLRGRARNGETKIALTPEYKQARTDLAGLLERAAPYRDQPWKFNRLLTTIGGITQQDLAALEHIHARASHHHRVVSLETAREKRRLARLANTEPQPLPPVQSPDVTQQTLDLIDSPQQTTQHAEVHPTDPPQQTAQHAKAHAPAPTRHTNTPPSPAEPVNPLERFLATTKRPRADDPAGRYLKHHAFTLTTTTNLRFHPRALAKQHGTDIHLPALLAPVRKPDGTLEAIHRIYLTPDGAPAPIERQQRTRGSPRTGAVWLFNPAKAERVVLCQSVEDALTLTKMLPTSAIEQVAIGATLQTSRAADVELPPTTRELLFIQPRDNEGEAAWKALRTHYANHPTLSLSRASPTARNITTDWINNPNALTAALLPRLDATPWLNTFNQLKHDLNRHDLTIHRPGVSPADHLSNYATIIERARSLLRNLQHQHGYLPAKASDNLGSIIWSHEHDHAEWHRDAKAMIRNHHITTSAYTKNTSPYYIPGYQELIKRVRQHTEKLDVLLIADTHTHAVKLRDIIAEHDTLKTALEPLSTYVDTVETHEREHPQLTLTPEGNPHARHELEAKYPQWLRQADQLIAAGQEILNNTDPAHRKNLNNQNFGDRIHRATESLVMVIRGQDEHRPRTRLTLRQKQTTHTQKKTTQQTKKESIDIEESPDHTITHGPTIGF